MGFITAAYAIWSWVQRIKFAKWAICAYKDYKQKKEDEKITEDSEEVEKESPIIESTKKSNK